MSTKVDRLEFDDSVDENTVRMKKRNKKKPMIVFLIVIGFLFLGGGFLLFSQYSIEKIEVTGNIHYTKAEIKEIVKENGYIGNSILLYLKNKIKPITNIPFVDSIEIEYINKNKIAIDVYEKSMAGCFEYMGEYVHFDKDGIVLESSKEKFEDVPIIVGLKFESFILHEKLPVKDEDTFSLILTITQQIRKNNLKIDKVRFNTFDEIILYSDTLKVMMGTKENINEKLLELVNIMESAKKLDKPLNGTLHMETYPTNGNAESKNFSFVENKQKKSKKSKKSVVK